MSAGARGLRFGTRERRHQLLEQRAAPVRDVAVQLGDRRDAVAQRGDLPDHVHAPLPLLGVQSTATQLGRPVAIDALRGDPQPADVELLEPAAQLLGVDPLGAQAAPLGLELLDERGGQAARRVAGPALEQHGVARRAIAASWNAA